MKRVYIYCLCHPLTKEIRYVGQTVKLLKYRLSAHLYDCRRVRNHRTNWINSLLKKGLKPDIKLIEEVNENNYIDREKHWILKYKELGYNLVNETEGGEGNLGHKHSMESIEKMSKSKRHQVAKEVYQYKLNGDFIRKFDCITDAAISVNGSPSKICSCCKGNRKKHKNYQWSYCLKEMSSYNRIYSSKVTENNSFVKRKRKVLVTYPDGSSQIFNSITECEKITCISNIWAHINNKYKNNSKNLKFQYYDYTS